MVEGQKPNDFTDIMAELQAIISGKTSPPVQSTQPSVPPAPYEPETPPTAPESALEEPSIAPPEPAVKPRDASPPEIAPPPAPHPAPSAAPTAPAAAPAEQAPPATHFEILYPRARPSFSGVPQTQIRRVALLYLSGQEAELKKLFQLLESTARTASKDPIYIDIALVAKIDSPGTNFQGLTEKIKAAHAVAAIGILSKLPWMSVRDLKQDFDSAQIFFRAVEESDIQKRESIVDLAVQLLLLSSS